MTPPAHPPAIPSAAHRPEPPAAHEIAEAGVDLALRLAGVRGCAVLVEETSTAALRWAANTLVAPRAATTRTVTAVVTTDHSAAAGEAGRGGPGPAGRGHRGVGVGVLTRRVEELADVGALVEDASLAAHAGEPLDDVDDFVAGPPSAAWTQPADPVPPRSLARVTPTLGEVLRMAAGEHRESFGRLTEESVTTWLATSGGLRLRHVQPVAVLEVTGLSHNRQRSAWAARAADDVAALDPAELDREIALRLSWQARRLDLRPGRYDVVLPPECVADLMVCLYLAGDARTAHGGRGPFARATGGTRVGERLSEQPLRLRSDPAEPGLRCAPAVLARSGSPIASVLDNGLPLPAQEWISEGVLRGLHTTRRTARLTGDPLRPAPGNLVLDHPEPISSTATTEDLAARLDRGLLATSFWFVQESDPRELLLTGVMRDGIYVVDGGEVIGVLGDRRFLESPLGMLDRIVEVGATRRAVGRDWGAAFSRTAMPPVRVSGFELLDVGPPAPGVP